MSADVIELDMITSLDIPPDRVLRKATEAGTEFKNAPWGRAARS